MGFEVFGRPFSCFMLSAFILRNGAKDSPFISLLHRKKTKTLFTPLCSANFAPSWRSKEHEYCTLEMNETIYFHTTRLLATKQGN